MSYLLDTNTIIYFLQQQFPHGVAAFIDNLLMTAKPCFSVITEIELLCWKTASPKDIQLIQNFVKDSKVIELESSIKYVTVDIRKAKKIKLPDAIIAATALVYNLTIVTRNVSDFENITDIKIINPWNYA